MSTIQFKSIIANNPKKSLFDNSFEHLTTCDMGKIYPVVCKEVVPGDIFKIGMRLILRMMPLIAPLLWNIKLKTYTFFIPNRLLWPKITNMYGKRDHTENGDWEEFITGGPEGDNTDTIPLKATNTTPIELYHELIEDYLNIPYNNHLTPDSEKAQALAIRAYNLTCNEYFLDQNYMTWVDLDNLQLRKACWEKDYFTSALPFQQRGTSPAIPLTGQATIGPLTLGGSAVWPSSTNLNVYWKQLTGTPQNQIEVIFNPGSTPPALFNNNLNGATAGTGGTFGIPAAALNTATNRPTISAEFPQQVIDMSNASTLDVNHIRTTFAVQRFMELNARSGVRYKEVLEARFGESIGDARIDRPEFIGGTTTPVIISEVLQTAAGGSPSSSQPVNALGAMGGHGISADESNIGTYKVKEHGWIMTMVVIRPNTGYSQGLHKQFFRKNRYEFLSPEFVNLSEQPVFRKEYLFANDVTANNTIEGYQGIYNEYRYSPNVVSGYMRPEKPQNLAHWHLSRLLAPNTEINASFMECNPDVSRILAVPTMPAFILHYGAIIHSVRPLPIIPTPSRIDHV